MSHVACRMSHVACRMSHVACCTSPYGIAHISLADCQCGYLASDKWVPILAVWDRTASRRAVLRSVGSGRVPARRVDGCGEHSPGWTGRRTGGRGRLRHALDAERLRSDRLVLKYRELGEESEALRDCLEARPGSGGRVFAAGFPDSQPRELDPDSLDSGAPRFRTVPNGRLATTQELWSFTLNLRSSKLGNPDPDFAAP